MGARVPAHDLALLTPPAARPRRAEMVALVLIPLLIVVLRLPAFFYTSAGLDEGLYYLMAHDLLAGHLPYTHTFDNKPPGIYLIFATAMLVFGRSTLAIRIASCLAIALGAYAMYALGKRATQRAAVGLTAAYGYVLYTSHVSGLEANTEIFFMPLVALAFALVWPSDGPRRAERGRVLIAGLLFGLAMCIKQSVVFDLATAIAVIVLYRGAGRVLQRLALLCLGVVLPLLLLPVPFLAAGEFQVFFQSAVAANVRRVGLGISVVQNALRIVTAFATLFPLLELLVVAPFLVRFARPGVALRRTIAIGVLWFLVDSAGVLALGVYEAHWILPLLLPLLLVGSAVLWVAADALAAPGRQRALAVTVALAAVALFQAFKPLAFGYEVVAHRIAVPADARYADRARVIASYLAARVDGADCVFIVTPESAFEYALAGATVPTRYGFSYFLTNPYGVRISHVDVEREVTDVFRCKPAFVVVQIPADSADLDPRFYEIAQPHAVPLSIPGVAATSAPWFLALQFTRRAMDDDYAAPVTVGGALVYARKGRTNLPRRAVDSFNG
jgi:hypothetical protein